MNHTPTPWTYDAGDSGDASVGMQATPPAIYADPDGNGDVYPICTLDDPCRRAERKPVDEYDECLEWSGSHDANAAFIVRACNAHDELVAALEDALPLLEKLALEEKRGNVRRKAMGDPLWVKANGVWDNARAALAKVQPANGTARMTPEQWEQFDLRR